MPLVSFSLRFGALILAAGSSSRMGEPKMLLPWAGTTILGHLIHQWREVGACQTAVVHAADHAAVIHELDRLRVPRADRIANPQPEIGMFGSILCAARWAGWDAALTHWIIVLGDQPHLRKETLESVLSLATEFPDQICQPSRDGRARHPVVLPRDLFLQIPTSQAGTLNDFLEANRARRTLRECGDPGLDLDLDFPADYQKAVRMSNELLPLKKEL